MADIDAFLAARDLLLANRTDIDAARAAFRWPKLDRFNFALDHFDRMAAGNETSALRFIGPGDHDSSVSFSVLSARSNQVANWLRGLGVGRGDRVLLLLGNVPALWEAMLACCKLGAVVVPATTMLTEDDLRDRFDRGRIAHAIVAGEHAGRFAALGDGYTKIAVGGAPGWQRFEDSYDAPAGFVPDGETRATDPLLLYFTSGTTAKPKLVLHSHQSYPVGHSVDHVLDRAAAGGRAPQHLLARLGQACVEQLLRAVDRRRHHRDPQPGAVRRQGAAGGAGPGAGHDVLRAADRMADADPGGPDGQPRPPA